jgi:TM2 domain-containing membrane protein YozV
MGIWWIVFIVCLISDVRICGFFMEFYASHVYNFLYFCTNNYEGSDS